MDRMEAEETTPGVFRGPKTLSIMPTYTCPAECKDCGTVSSPRDRTQLPLETILAGIEEAKALGFCNVVFTGGEPTLRWKDLLAAIGHAKSLGFPTRVVTNAYWATCLDTALERIDALIAAGLDEINYSTGDEHVRFVPLERVILATIAAARRRMRCHIMVELRLEQGVTKDDIFLDPRFLELSDEERRFAFATESPWMPLSPSEIERYPEGVCVNRSNLAIRQGCDSVLQTYVMEADGRIGSCCGLGMRIIPELNVARTSEDGFLARAIEEAEGDFLKLWLHYIGPEKILAWAATKEPSIEWEDRYAHRCQACLRIYKDPQVGKVIREHYQEMIAEVIQSVWLEEAYIPDRLGGTIQRTTRVPAPF